MKRLFTFGCSMTNYIYPTWADILGTNYDYYENWGEEGAGNEFIFNSIIECNEKNHFNSEDTIIVMWSGIARNGFYDKCWKHQTHLQNAGTIKTLYKKESISIKGFEIKNYVFINAIYNLFKHYNLTMITWVDFDGDSSIYEFYQNSMKHVLKVDLPIHLKTPHKRININYKTHFITGLYERLSGPSWPSLNNLNSNDYIACNHNITTEIDQFYDIINNSTFDENEYEYDIHPLPYEHLSMCNSVFNNYTLNSEVIEWINDVHYKLTNDIPYFKEQDQFFIKYCNPIPVNRL